MVRESAAIPLNVLEDDIADAAITRAMVETMLASIAPADAIALTMRFVDGLSDAAVARELGVCTRTIRRRRFRALSAFRSLLDANDWL